MVSKFGRANCRTMGLTICPHAPILQTSHSRLVNARATVRWPERAAGFHFVMRGALYTCFACTFRASHAASETPSRYLGYTSVSVVGDSSI
ncbi:hypothetical protein PAXRUDRAFT_822135 [Paxillus rubicundulus Ve08.2h10]|uniref:Uncharacterized protein n=1 Tax=Paxillus rubicundulus Ve08.2h10 TaxID=930991 RepID=A0A0D0EA46_9AGAM|nr:hypothetical protein PAXRUDRAFT_822135 [Paxillus rubicundulus Ve08.2h10]